MKIKDLYRISNHPICDLDEYCCEKSCQNCHKTNYLHIKKGTSIASVFADRPICRYCGCAIADDKTWNLPHEKK